MNENERSLITSALAIISQTVEASERDERAAYYHRLNVEQSVRGEVDAAWKEQVGRLNGELHDAKERIHHLLSTLPSDKKAVDDGVVSRQSLENWASNAQRGLNETVDLVRAIKVVCNGHRDSECSKQVNALIDGYHKKLSERVPRSDSEVVLDSLRQCMDQTREARIAAAKLSADAERIFGTLELKDGGKPRHTDAVWPGKNPFYVDTVDGVLHINADMINDRSQLDRFRGQSFPRVRVFKSWLSDELAQYAADVLGPLTRSE